jgi:hypothetical protein
MAYTNKQGRTCDNFSKSRQKQEHIGRDTATEFLEQQGFTVTDNDRKENGKIDYTKPDLLAIHNETGKKLQVEAEGKNDKGWGYALRGGLDLPARKEKMVDAGMNIHIMVKYDRTELFITRRSCFKDALAKRNQCEMITGKYCWNADAGTRIPNDFFRIAVCKLIHYKKVDGIWTRVDKTGYKWC